MGIRFVHGGQDQNWRRQVLLFDPTKELCPGYGDRCPSECFLQRLQHEAGGRGQALIGNYGNHLLNVEFHAQHFAARDPQRRERRTSI